MVALPLDFLPSNHQNFSIQLLGAQLNVTTLRSILTLAPAEVANVCNIGDPTEEQSGSGGAGGAGSQFRVRVSCQSGVEPSFQLQIQDASFADAAQNVNVEAFSSVLVTVGTSLIV